MKDTSRPELTIKAAVDPAKQWTLVELKAHGEKIYAGNCVACHQATGMGVPGNFPALSGSKRVTGPKQAQINEALYGVVKDGKPAAMVSFKHLSDAHIAAFHVQARQLGQQDRRRGHPARRQILAEVSTR